MTTLGIIGAGHIGSNVARAALAHGYDVVISNSRGPDTLGDLVAELGAGARAATAEDAVRDGDLVVVAIPLKNYRSVPADAVGNKVVIDANNYYPQRDGQIAGDDERAKSTVAALLDDFGFDVVDAGPLAEGWRYQRDEPAYVARQTADELRTNLAAATRYRDQ